MKTHRDAQNTLHESYPIIYIKSTRARERGWKYEENILHLPHRS